MRFATEGRDAGTVARFAADLVGHRGDPKQITTTSSDMSAAFISGITEYLPNAQLTFDRYHLAAKLSEAVDAVRRAEVATRPELTHTRWLWCKNWANLSTGQRSELQRLLRPWSPARHRTSAALARGLPGPSTTSIPATRPSICAAGAPGRNAPGCSPSRTSSRWSNATGTPVITWHATHVSNGLLEGTNSLIQAAKARARGYRTKNKMITIAYLIVGQLPLPTVTNPSPA